MTEKVLTKNNVMRNNIAKPHLLAERAFVRGRGGFNDDRLRGRAPLSREEEALNEQNHRRALAFLEVVRLQQNTPPSGAGFGGTLGFQSQPATENALGQRVMDQSGNGALFNAGDTVSGNQEKNEEVEQLTLDSNNKLPRSPNTVVHRIGDGRTVIRAEHGLNRSCSGDAESGVCSLDYDNDRFAGGLTGRVSILWLNDDNEWEVLNTAAAPKGGRATCGATTANRRGGCTEIPGDPPRSNDV